MWGGVNHNLALRNLREVRLGDHILIYHSGNEGAIIGLAEAVSEPYPDPGEQDEKIVVVNIKPKRRFAHRVTLSEIKNDDVLKDFDLVSLPLVSVMPIKDEHWQVLQDMLR